MKLRSIMFWRVELLALLLITGCGSRGELAFAPEAGAIGTLETVLVSSSRTAVEGLPLYTRDRSEAPQFARFDIAVPPDRAAGTVSYPGSRPNAKTDFLVVSAGRIADRQAFTDAIDAAMAADPSGDRHAAIFIHGFNTNFAEGLYRQAQMQHDFDSHGAFVHFSWPSAAYLLGYDYDRESALYSREALETTILALARSDASRINLISHSMGGFLLMDTLWMMARVGYPQVFDKINAVILMSPDIEVDTFRRQAPAVLARGVPIFVFVSRQDRALAVSARISGEQDRLGSIRHAEEIGGLNVAVLDISEVQSTDMLGHFKEASSPALIDFMRGLGGYDMDMFDEDKDMGLLNHGGALVQQGADILVAPLARP